MQYSRRHPGETPRGLLRKRKIVINVCKNLAVSERRACRVLGQARSTQRYTREVKSEEEMLTEEIVNLATQYGDMGIEG